MVEPAYILLEAAGGVSAFGCVTGAFACRGDPAAIEFDWNGNDGMDEARGSGWAEIQAAGSLQSEIGIHAGDEIPFIACRWPTSSTVC